MKRFFAIAAAAILFAGIMFTATTVNAGDKETICHFDNSSDELGHIKEVNVESLPEHIYNHGDLTEYEVLEDGKTCRAILLEQ
jgi:hypothetical protein